MTKEIVAGSSLTIGVIFNDEYDKSRLTRIRYFLNRQIVGDLDSAAIQQSSDGLFVAQLSGNSTYSMRGNYTLQIQIVDEILGIVNIIVGPIKFLATAATSSGDEKSQACTITVPIIMDGSAVVTDPIVVT